MAIALERPIVNRKTIIIPGRGRGSAQGGPFENNSVALYRDLCTALGEKALVYNPNWGSSNSSGINNGVLSLAQRLRAEQQNGENVKVAVIGDDWGGNTAYEVAAMTNEIDRVVVISTRINPDQQSQLPRVQRRSPEELWRERTAPLARGVKLLTISPVSDPHVPFEEGTSEGAKGVTTVVYPIRDSHSAGIRAILSDPEIRERIVLFVTDGSTDQPH